MNTLSKPVKTCQDKESGDRQRSSTTQKKQAAEAYERPQRIPRMGYETPLHRLTWTLDLKSIVTLARFEENLKHRGNQ